MMLHGWRSLPLLRNETLGLALYRQGKRVATVEVFESVGPYYANAVTPEGEELRLGAGISLANAVAWAEWKTGFCAEEARPA